MDFSRWPPGFQSLPPLFAGPGAQPISVMIKPPETLANEIGGRRRLGISTRVTAATRLHTTVLPLCDGRAIATALIDLLGEVLLSLDAEPFPIGFNRVRGNALAGGRNPGVHDLHRRLVLRLAVLGITAPPYPLRPHLSLTYGEQEPRNFPVGWIVERVLLVRSFHDEARHELCECRLIPRQGELPFCRPVSAC